MPYNYPDRIAVATSSTATPIGFVKADVSAPDIAAFADPAPLDDGNRIYSDSGLVAARTGLYFNGAETLVDEPRTMDLIGLQVASNVTNNYVSGVLPASNTFTEDSNEWGYFDQAYHAPFFENVSSYLIVQFANCFYRPWPTGSFEIASALEDPMPARVAQGNSVLGSTLGAPISFQFSGTFRGPGANYSAIKAFRRTESGGTDIDGSAYRMIGVQGKSAGVPTAGFVNLFEFGDTHTDVQCVINSVHASASSNQMSAIGRLSYTVLGVPTFEKYLAIFTPVDLYAITGDPIGIGGGTAIINPADSQMYTPKLQNLNGVGSRDIENLEFVGFPGGFYGYNLGNSKELFIVNADWTQYTQYSVIENDQGACDAIAVGGLKAIRTSDDKWILYSNLATPLDFVQLVEGPAAPSWVGCGGTLSVPPLPAIVTGDVIVRAWPLSLDGHDMYVLRLGTIETLIYDKLSKQWFSWASKDNAVWAVNTGFEWLGGVGIGATNIVVGDDTTGTLYFLNPEQPFDSPEILQEVYFDRIVMGQLPIRGREVMPCYTVWITGDMGQPAYSGAGVTLYSSDNGGETWFSHGSIEVTSDVFRPELLWTSLGQIQAPGRLFMIIDDGALTRIDDMQMNDPDDG
jgi:hypothetical protein